MATNGVSHAAEPIMFPSVLHKLVTCSKHAARYSNPDTTALSCVEIFLYKHIVLNGHRFVSVLNFPRCSGSGGVSVTTKIEAKETPGGRSLVKPGEAC